MFWHSAANSNAIDNLLDQPDVNLTTILDQDEVLMEIRGMNKKLLEFLTRPECMYEMVDLITTVPSADIPLPLQYKYPNTACEVLTSDISFAEKIAAEHTLMGKLFHFFRDSEPPLNPLLASYVGRVLGEMIARKLDQNWYSYQLNLIQVMGYLQSEPSLLDWLLKHLETSAVCDFLHKLVMHVEGQDMRANLYEWLEVREKFFMKLVNSMDRLHSRESHMNVSRLVGDLLFALQDESSSSSQDRSMDSEPFLLALKSNATFERLLDVIFGEDTLSQSSIVYGLEMLLALLGIAKKPMKLSSSLQRKGRRRRKKQATQLRLAEIVRSACTSAGALSTNILSGEIPDLTQVAGPSTSLIAAAPSVVKEIFLPCLSKIVVPTTSGEGAGQNTGLESGGPKTQVAGPSTSLVAAAPSVVKEIFLPCLSKIVVPTTSSEDAGQNTGIESGDPKIRVAGPSEGTESGGLKIRIVGRNKGMESGGLKVQSAGPKKRIQEIDPPLQTETENKIDTTFDSHDDITIPYLVRGMLISKMETLLRFLQCPPNARQAIRLSNGVLKEPLGMERLAIVRFIAHVITLHDVELNEALIQSGVLRKALDLFWEYPWNNFLHHYVCQILIQISKITRSNNCAKFVLIDYNFLGMVMDAFEDEGLKCGYMGHLAKIASTWIECLETNDAIKSLLPELDDARPDFRDKFQQFYSEKWKAYHAKSIQLLAGAALPTSGVSISSNNHNYESDPGVTWDSSNDAGMSADNDNNVFYEPSSSSNYATTDRYDDEKSKAIFEMFCFERTNSTDDDEDDCAFRSDENAAPNAASYEAEDSPDATPDDMDLEWKNPDIFMKRLEEQEELFSQLNLNGTLGDASCNTVSPASFIANPWAGQESVQIDNTDPWAAFEFSDDAATDHWAKFDQSFNTSTEFGDFSGGIDVFSTASEPTPTTPNPNDAVTPPQEDEAKQSQL